MQAIRLVIVGVVAAVWACSGAIVKQPWPNVEPILEPLRLDDPESMERIRSRDWIAETMGLEVELPGPQAYESVFWRGKALSRKPLLVREGDGSSAFDADIGAPVPVECVLSSDYLDVADMTMHFAVGVMKSYETKGHTGVLEANEIRATDAGAEAGNPWIAAEWRYRVRLTGQGLVFGYLKIATVKFGSQVASCWHHLPGYRNSFREWFKHFVANSKQGVDAEPEPSFIELSISELDGTRVGFNSFVVTTDGAGGSRIEEISSQIYPGMSAKPHAIDSRMITFADEAGKLLRGTYTLPTEPSLVKIHRVTDGYRVRALLADKKIQFHLAAGEPIDSPLAIERALHNALRLGAPQHLRFRHFMAAIPDRILDIEAQVNPENSDRLRPVSLTIGAMQAVRLYNTEAECVSDETEISRGNLRSVVVYRSGSL